MTNYNQTLTLRMIRDHTPCGDGWEILLAHLGKTAADDEPLTIAEIYGSNGFDDALWCLRALPDDCLSRHFQAWCAEQVLPIFERERLGDSRVRDQIAMLRNDAASKDEREAARAAAEDAAFAANDTSRAAACGSAWAIAKAAARAARAAACGYAWAARVAARDAACGYAWATSIDAMSVGAWGAAWDAARAAQEREFRKMIGL